MMTVICRELATTEKLFAVEARLIMLFFNSGKRNIVWPSSDIGDSLEVHLLCQVEKN